MTPDVPSTTFLVSLAAGIAAIVAAIIATGGNLLNAWIIRRSEERRQIRELAVRAAIEEWKKHMELGEKYGLRNQPLDLYLIHSMYFVKTLDGSLRTKEEIRSHVRDVNSITDAAWEEIENYNKNK